MVTLQHVRDVLGDLAVVCDVNDVSPALIADHGVKGVRIPQGMVLFDVSVADTNAVSYVNHSVPTALSSAEKKCKLLSDAELHHTSFTPLLYLLMGYLVMRI